MWLTRLQQNLIQYGFTKNKLLQRFAGQSAPIVLANSIPKAGTNLVLRALYLMPLMHRKPMRTLTDSLLQPVIRRRLCELKQGEIAAAHLKYSVGTQEALHELDMRHVLMIRDPRDIAVSNYIYITYKDHKHRLHGYFSGKLKDDNERLTASLKGIPARELHDGVPSLSLAEHLAGFSKWLEDPDVLVVKFESLVGSRGGGADDLQRAALHDISAHIGIDLSPAEHASICEKLFSQKSRTFVKGQVGTWRNCFGEEHYRIVEEELCELIRVYGYEL